MECIGRNNTHTIFFILPDDSKEIKCPYILAYPHEYKENNPIILEVLLIKIPNSFLSLLLVFN